MEIISSLKSLDTLLTDALNEELKENEPSPEKVQVLAKASGILEALLNMLGEADPEGTEREAKIRSEDAQRGREFIDSLKREPNPTEVIKKT